MPQPILPRSHRHPVVDALLNTLLTVLIFGTALFGPSWIVAVL